jgi:hypothetical protein
MALILFWILSYFIFDEWSCHIPHTIPRPIFLRLHAGLIAFNGYNPFPFGRPVHFRIMGFRIYTRFNPQSTSPWLIGIPFYAPVLVTLLLPVSYAFAATNYPASAQSAATTFVPRLTDARSADKLLGK